MKQTSLAILLIAFSALGILVLNGAYVVDEAEQVVVTQFGEPIGLPIKEPGLHWKTPFVQDVRKFDKRILNWDGYPSEVPTLDKKFIWVDVTGRWRIENPLLFLQTMHNERNAQSRLDDIMDGITRNHISRYNLVDIVRSSNDILDLGPQNEDAMGEIDLEKVEIGRYQITREIIEAARKVVKEYGIQLVDLRIKRINYVDTVQKRVFERMISERTRAAEQLRSEGQGVRAEVEGQREKELKRINSEAYRQAQAIRGEADAKAMKIYGDAYGLDPEFYAFMSTLEKYPTALKDSRVVLTTESDFLRYLKKAE
ncbi:MAG: protease modulator HflC [Candidatus Omnitrophica bacterium]|nr:protease modulator HflC [Candidatus Omnitrophota bacterium]